MELVAVNHWPVALATHRRQFPKARHYCINLDAARPEEIVPDGYLDLLMASPECKHHSRARGGKPVNDQMRMSAWHVQRWATTLHVRTILVENVPEFTSWGPLCRLAAGHAGPHSDKKRAAKTCDKPVPELKGMYFQAWVQALWSLGYRVDYKVLNAADYGDATTRKRFFLQARKDGKAIRWPEATHSRNGSKDMFGGTLRWRAAAEVIDWEHPGPSLISRKRPLSVNTLRRIARGLQKFGGALAAYYIRLLDLPPDEEAAFVAGCKSDPNIRPFLVGNRNNNVAKAAEEEPVPTATTSTGGGICLIQPSAEPFVLGQQSGSVARHTENPLPTIATDGAISLVKPSLAEPSIIAYYGRDDASSSVEHPLPTVTTEPRFALCQPMLAEYYGQSDASPIDKPVPTITTRDRFALCQPTAEPFLTKHYGESSTGGVDEPVPTVTGGGGHVGVCSPLILPYGPKADARPADQPLQTIMTKERLAVASPSAEPFVPSRHVGCGGAERPHAPEIDEPQPTVTVSEPGDPIEPVAGPFLVPQFGEREEQAPRIHHVSDPLPSVTSHGAGALVQPVLVQIDQSGSAGKGVRSACEPLATVVTKANLAVASPSASAVSDPLILQMSQTGRRDSGMARLASEPVPTITTHNNLGVATPSIYVEFDPHDPGFLLSIDPRRLVYVNDRLFILDIFFRMLRNRELARAMGFDDDETEYEFVGSVSDVTMQIGNAVPVHLAAALVKSILDDLPRRRRAVDEVVAGHGNTPARAARAANVAVA